ncbi:MAG: Outer membrane cobalamin receptor protein (precursor) [Candidatus Tokpelaia hoelldobleri]|uniref:Outer membrane cobalamin receptor protein (Precursor) n=1 Tax=Candidatus Tokpelaia hoelldobleri TaxID=1902579 RepID=A0A1U9JWB1_9HYPH|nr:MAG: Outer membrane cobalamin receptor protein (precursor) [Candidatus Tokpelaia hoelldoblerii]
MQKFRVQPACAGLLLSCAVGYAQGGAADGRKDDTLLETVTISGGLTTVEKDKSGHAYTIITSKELEQSQTRSVADALRQVPGISVSRSGSYGGLTAVRMRGAESNHVLVLIDGIEANGLSDGAFNFGDMQAVDIERIEILRGPQGAFYGSNALAGVINIITKSGIRNDWRIGGQTEAGTHKSWLGGVLLQGGGENYDLALSAAYRRTDGFSIAPGGAEHDGDKNLTLNGKLNVDVSETLALDATMRFTRHKVDLDGTGAWGSVDEGRMVDRDNRSDTDIFIGSLGFTHKALDGALTSRARLSGNSNTMAYYMDGEPGSGNRGSRLTGSTQVSYAFDTPSFADARHVISGGADWRREHFRAQKPVSDASQLDWRTRDSTAFIGEYRLELFDRLNFNASLRHDVNDDFKDATTYNLASSWRLPDGRTRLHASVGTGVANPTFYEQFGYLPNSFIGNPALKPEKSTGWDIGVEQAFWDGRIVGDVTYFRQNLKEEIATKYLPDFTSTPYNQAGTSKRQGVEVALTFEIINGLTAHATYTWLEAEDPDGACEVRRPEHSGSANVAYVFYEERARVFAQGVFNGKMRDSVFAPGLPSRITLDHYTVVNLGGSFKFNDHLEVFARIENVFDEKYQEIFDYNTQGRAFFIGLRGAL